MPIGEKTVGLQTSAFPTTLKTFPAQTELNDPPTPDPDFAEGRDANAWSAEVQAIEGVLGASPRGLVDVVGSTATVGAFRTTDGTSVIVFPGASIALTPGLLNYLYFDMVTPTLAKSTTGWPAFKHVPLATWPGSGTAVADMRPHFPPAALPPIPHASGHLSGATDELDADKADIDYAPPGYAPSAAGSPGGATTTAHLSAHLKGISDALLGKASATQAINTQPDSYTLVLADAGKRVELDKATANSLTVPTHASVPFPIGTRIDVVQIGTGATTIVAAGGVTISVAAPHTLVLAAQYAVATLYKRATDAWVAFGDLA